MGQETRKSLLDNMYAQHKTHTERERLHPYGNGEVCDRAASLRVSQVVLAAPVMQALQAGGMSHTSLSCTAPTSNLMKLHIGHKLVAPYCKSDYSVSDACMHTQHASSALCSLHVVYGYSHLA